MSNIAILGFAFSRPTECWNYPYRGYELRCQQILNLAIHTPENHPYVEKWLVSPIDAARATC